MHSEDVKCVVAAEEVFQLGSVVASYATTYTKDDGGPCRHITGSGGNGYETCNDARAEPNGGPFALQTIINQAPSDAADAGR